MINFAILADALLLIALENTTDCPECDGSLDTGTGFGKRDYDCDECDFSASFPVIYYFTFLRFLP